MGFLEKIYEKARKMQKRILLCEGHDHRVREAIKIIIRSKLCNPVIIGDAYGLKGVDTIDYRNSPLLERYISLYCDIRRHKNIKADEARRIIIDNPVFFAALMVSAGDADGFVAGAATTTRDVAKAAIHCIGPAEDIKTISGAILIMLLDKRFGSRGAFIYADAGIIPEPTSEQLADIAISSAEIWRLVLEDEPRIAMLSYSTKGSGGNSPSIVRVQKATGLVRERRPDLMVDGEIQLDCAVVPEVATIKDPDSRIKGRANILIFPNLDAANISYKLTQRFAKARAIGPLLQGLKKPVSDLSRGCDIQDIVDAVAITAIRAQGC